MYSMHPDDATPSVQLRQSIVRQGISAARRPGDLAAMRERIGEALIALGTRLQGRRPSLPATAPRQAMRPARQGDVSSPPPA